MCMATAHVLYVQRQYESFSSYSIFLLRRHRRRFSLFLSLEPSEPIHIYDTWNSETGLGKTHSQNTSSIYH